MNKDKNNTYVSGGTGFVGLLQITFIVLKLCGVINWSWWLVLLPSIISVGLTIILLIVCFIVAAVMSIKEEKNRLGL